MITPKGYHNIDGKIFDVAPRKKNREEYCLSRQRAVLLTSAATLEREKNRHAEKLPVSPKRKDRDEEPEQDIEAQCVVEDVSSRGRPRKRTLWGKSA